MKLKDIIKMIAEEKESEFKPLSDLEYAIKQHEKGNDYYDKTKLKNIFNQLSPEDQKEARKKYSKSLNEDFFGLSPDILLQGALLAVTLASLGLSVDDAAQPGGILNPDSDEDSKPTYKPDLKTKIKRWWWHLKNDRTINKIIDRLKTDPEIVDYINDKNKTGIRSAIEKKLKPEELKYLKILTRDKLK